MPGSLLGTLIVGIAGALAMAYAAKVNAKSSTTSSLDNRAAKVLEEALDYQSKTIASQDARIVGLTDRVDALEAEVAACERGRADDRKRWAAELADMRRELGHQ